MDTKGAVISGTPMLATRSGGGMVFRLIPRGHWRRHGSKLDETPESAPYKFPKPDEEGWPTTQEQFDKIWSHSCAQEDRRQRDEEKHTQKLNEPQRDEAERKEKQTQEEFITQRTVFRDIFKEWNEELIGLPKKFAERWKEKLAGRQSPRPALFVSRPSGCGL